MECQFCRQNIRDIDSKNIELLSRFISPLKKIRGRNKTGLCSHHQKRLARAIKRARVMGLLPCVPK